MEQHPDSTVQRHQLRVRLRRARESAGLTRKQTAAALVWSESKLVRIEAGQVGLSQTDLRALLDLYGVQDPEAVKELAELAQQSRRQPWKAYRDVLNAEFIVYLGYEGPASQLRSFQPSVIHGLLQTEDYARSLIHAKGLIPPDGPAGRLERAIEARMKRQALLYSQDAPQMSFVLHELAVRQPPGTDDHAREVLRAQLQRLKELARLPAVSIQILPISYGVHPGSDGPFTVLQFADSNGGVVYKERAHTGAVIREEAEEVAYYGRLFDQLAAAATHPSDLDRCLDDLAL